MESNTTRISNSWLEKERNAHGTGYVPCYISERWLQFADTYDKDLNFVFLDVMTKDSNEKDKKLCPLSLNINELKATLEKIKPE